MNMIYTIAIACAISVVSLQSAAQAQNILLPPFVGSLSSVFGPRDTGIPGATTFHEGIDYAAAEASAIPAVVSGPILDIVPFPGNVKTSTTGNAMRVGVGDGKYVEYYHMFPKTEKKLPVKDTKGRFKLDKMSFISGESTLRAANYCYVIFDKTTKNAWVAQKCPRLNTTSTVNYGGIAYTIKSDINKNEIVGPVGNSSSVSIGYHLHLVYADSRGRRNPIGKMNQIAGTSSDASLKKSSYSSQDIAGGDISLGIAAKIGKANLNGIKVEIYKNDSPAQILYSKSVIYGGIDNQQRVGLSGKSSRPIEVFPQSDPNSGLVCTTKSSSVVVWICPKSWKGEQTKDAFFTDFYFPVGLNSYKGGDYTVRAQLQYADTTSDNYILPLKIEGEDGPSQFWQGHFRVTACNTPNYSGAGNSCQQVSQPYGGSNSEGTLTFKTGPSEANNMRFDDSVFGFAYCTGSTIPNISVANSFVRSVNLQGTFFQDAETTNITYTVTSRGPLKISGTYTATFNYPIPGEPGFPPLKAQGSLTGTWEATPRTTSFPKCVYQPPADRCTQLGKAAPAGQGFTSDCDWRTVDNVGRLDEWATSP